MHFDCSTHWHHGNHFATIGIVNSIKRSLTENKTKRSERKSKIENECHCIGFVTF